MPKSAKMQVKKTYGKRVPETVSLLTEEQVRKVISEAFPKRPADTPEFISELQTGINNALASMVPLLSSEGMSDIEDLQKVFKALSKKLTKANLRLLEELGGAHRREIDRLSPASPVPRVLTSTLERLVEASEKVGVWLADAKATTVVTERQKALADLQTVAGHSLPDLYQMTFFESYGSGISGDGPGFVEAVLREAGVEPDYPERIPERAKKNRQRILESVAAPKKRKDPSPE